MHYLEPARATEFHTPIVKCCTLRHIIRMPLVLIQYVRAVTAFVQARPSLRCSYLRSRTDTFILLHCMLRNFSCFCSSFFFQNQLFKKNSFRNTIRVSNSLNPDQTYVLSFGFEQTVCKCYQQMTNVAASSRRIYV